MKKNFILLFLIMMLAQMGYAQDSEQMVFKNDFRETSGSFGNLTTRFLQDWTDANGEDPAIIRVTVVDMSVSEMKKLDVKGSSDLGLNKKQFAEKEHQWYFAITAGKDIYLEMTHPTYGVSSRLRITQQLKAKTIYDVTLVNNRTVAITVKSTPDGADVKLDGDLKGKTPITIPGTTYGKHLLELSYNGTKDQKEIDVDEVNTVFDKFDFRETTLIDITSDPDGASIFIDDDPNAIGLAPIKGYRVILGSHTFRAINPKNPAQNDEKTIRVTKGTTLVDMHPVKKGNVLVTTAYGGSTVAADLVVDAGQRLSGERAYNVLLPYGKHSLMVQHMGKTKQKTINVNKPEQSYKFKLSAGSKNVWPWEREFDQRPFGFGMGYVQKDVVMKNGSLRSHGEPAYGIENEKLHGMSMGIHFQPTLPWGLGFYSGTFFEVYAKTSDEWADGSSVSDDMKNFTELSLNVPLHLYFRLAFSRNFSIAVHGGVGFDLGLYACYSEGFLGTRSQNSTTTEVYDKYYGEENGGPNWFNMTWDIAGTINMGPVGISAQWSKGLTTHNGMLTDYAKNEGWNAYINKFGITVSWLFGAD